MIIQVKVHPNSGKEGIVKLNEKEYKVFLKKPAEDNKANIELLKLLKKHFMNNPAQKINIFSSASSKPQHKTNGFDDIKIIKGLKSRNKIVKIGD